MHTHTRPTAVSRVNGVSLTVNKVSDAPSGSAVIEINIIPHTHQVTTIRLLRKGAKVNLEIDQLARYVERILQTQTPARDR